MVEYTYDEAVALLESNLATALDKKVRESEHARGGMEKITLACWVLLVESRSSFVFVG